MRPIIVDDTIAHDSSIVTHSIDYSIANHNCFVSDIVKGKSAFNEALDGAHECLKWSDWIEMKILKSIMRYVEKNRHWSNYMEKKLRMRLQRWRAKLRIPLTNVGLKTKDKILFGWQSFGECGNNFIHWIQVFADDILKDTRYHRLYMSIIIELHPR